MFLIITLQLTLLFVLCYQDFKTKKVNLYLLLSFCGINTISYQPDSLIFATAITVIIIIMKIIIELYKQQTVLGMADVIIIFPMLSNINPIDIPLFFLIAGIIGIIFAQIWRFLLHQESYPFIPPLSCAYIFCLYLKHQNFNML